MKVLIYSYTKLSIYSSEISVFRISVNGTTVHPDAQAK